MTRTTNRPPPSLTNRVPIFNFSGMNALRIVGRIILILLMISTGFQSLVGFMRIMAAIHKPEAISYMIGQFIGSLLLFMLFMWLFKKLGPKRADA
jgi:flagellar biogenesis protein FliO